MTFDICASLATTTVSTDDCEQWRSFENTNSVGALRNITITTLVVCKSWCVANQRCVAVDWDSNNAGCWVHTNPSNLLQQYEARGVVQYQLTGCDRTGLTTAATTGMRLVI